jgi:hypothetical protein
MNQGNRDKRVNKNSPNYKSEIHLHERTQLLNSKQEVAVKPKPQNGELCPEKGIVII